MQNKFILFVISLLAIMASAVFGAAQSRFVDLPSAAYATALEVDQIIHVQTYTPERGDGVVRPTLSITVTGDYGGDLFVKIENLRVTSAAIAVELSALPEFWATEEVDGGVLVRPNKNKNPSTVLRVLCNQLRGAYGVYFVHAMLQDANANAAKLLRNP